MWWRPDRHIAGGEIHVATPGLCAQILLETTAGQGTRLGYRFEHLAWLLYRKTTGPVGVYTSAGPVGGTWRW